MAHAAVSEQRESYSRTSYIIRSKLYAGFRRGSMNVRSLADDDRIKLIYDKRCCYCGTGGRLSLDHLIPKVKGGPESSDNLVWCCRSCNSSKGGRDLMEWYSKLGQFPPLLLIRRYLKLALDMTERRGMLDTPLDDPIVASLPVRLDLLAIRFPPPGRLTLWAFELGVESA
jgi:hypothetical protein